jgi:hypothetical protein
MIVTETQFLIRLRVLCGLLGTSFPPLGTCGYAALPSVEILSAVFCHFGALFSRPDDGRLSLLFK